MAIEFAELKKLHESGNLDGLNAALRGMLVTIDKNEVQEAKDRGDQYVSNEQLQQVAEQFRIIFENSRERENAPQNNDKRLTFILDAQNKVKEVNYS